MTSMKRCRKILAMVWLLGGGALLIILIVQTTFGKLQNPTDAFNWFLPTVLPTLTLIMGVFTADAVGGASDTEADSFTFKLALGMSVAYLLIASLTIFLEPLSDMGSEQLMKTSNLWLGPLQGLTAASMGVFFVKRS